MDDRLASFFSEENLSEVWRYIQQYAGDAGREATRLVLELFFVMKSPSTSAIDKGIIAAALAYQLLPEDLLPKDRFGLLSLLDNGVTIAFAYSRMKADVTPEISAQVDSILNQWFGEQRVKDATEASEPNDYVVPTPSVGPLASGPYRPLEEDDVIVD